MADNTRVNELQEKLLQAMDILNAKALDSVSYDKTIICTIENDENKKDGKYEVSDGSIIFTAYSIDERYRNGDVVYVTIPQGNYENQKMIVGKKTSDIEQPFNFITPFDNIFDMTGNVVEKQLTEGKLIANAKDTEKEKYERILVYHETNCNYSNYTRLGLKANFKSWIKNAVKGDYGLHAVLMEEIQLTVAEIEELDKQIKNLNAEINKLDPDIPEQALQIEIYQQQILDYEIKKLGKTTPHIFTLNSSNMYGNPYSFETDYEQQIVVPLDNVKGTIIDVQVFFYQDANFYDQFDKELPYQSNDGTMLLHNLFVNDIYLCMGYDLSTFTTDFVEIYTEDRDSYKRSTDASSEDANEAVNQKNIKMRWVHIKDGTPIDMVAAAGKLTGDDQPNYEVRWYKYRVGAAAADPYCGIYWERINDVVGFNFTFNPDVNKQQEKIKAIVVYEGNTPYRSNELIFENEEELPPSEEAQHIMNALVITCEDKSNGNYMIYGQDNSIKDTQYSKETRKLEAWFDVNNDGQIDQAIEKINDDGIKNLIWTFPENNSMIQLINGDDTGELDENEQPILSKSVVTGRIPEYKISSYYSPSKANNTVICQYTLNGVVYTTEKEFTFGPAGTMGSDQTLIIDFVGDKNSVIEGEEVVKFEIQLYDNQNKQQVIPDGSVKWKWYYNSDLKDDSGKLIDFPQDIECSNATWNSEYDFDLGGLYILQASVGNLTTYFPVPITDSSGEYSYIKGATQVIYQSSGEPFYNREEYQLFKKDDKVVENINWRVVSFEEDPYMATLSDLINHKGFLKPVQVYVRNASVYGVQAYFQNEEDITILWTQPILVMQNQWSSNVINKWDGKSIEMDKDKGTILSQAIAAGHKDSENRFSGVMIGSWKDTDTAPDITAQTGIYGFHQGAMSYAWKDDGTGFIGKDGLGRINFDGNKATIYSSEYKIDNQGDITNEKLTGSMTIDLNDPYIKMKRGGNEIVIDASKTGEVTGVNSPNAPFKIGSNFAVSWDGTLYAANGEFSGTIYADDGTLQNLDITGELSIIKGGALLLEAEQIDADGPIYIQYKKNSKVTKLGSIGMVKGKDGDTNSTTYNIGITSAATTDTNTNIKPSIVLESNRHIRFSADGTVFIDAEKISFNTGSTPDVAAENQTGIYARFA